MKFIGVSTEFSSARCIWQNE